MYSSTFSLVVMHLVFYLSLYFLNWTTVISLCQSGQGYVCCPGTYWNERTLVCERCPLGYHDINCSEGCKFPAFGEDCQSECKCNFDLCDHRFGCTGHIKTTYTATSFPKNLQVTSDKPRNTNRNSSETTHSDIPNNSQVLPRSVLYIIIASVVLFGVCVGTYFYKHCIKQTAQSDDMRVEYHSNELGEGYTNLNHSSYHQVENNSDPTYMEPDYSPEYEMIKNDGVMNDTSLVSVAVHGFNEHNFKE